jgi:hypothetical protein
LKKHPNLAPVAKKMIEMHQMQHHMALARAAMPPMSAMLGVAQPQGQETTGDRLQAAASTDQKRRMDLQRRQQQMQRQTAAA